MLYIVTEDTNSARYFWECVAKTFKKQSEYKLVEINNFKVWRYTTGNI